MQDEISTIFNSNNQVSSRAEDFYSEYWKNGNGITEPTKWKNNRILDHFFPNGLSGQRILEIGVGGEGGMLYPLKSKNEVEGVDVSDSAIINCRNFGLEVKKHNLDKDILPFPDEYFDVIFAFEVFEHFSNPQFALEEIKRVLKSEGLFILSIPTPLTYHWPRLFYPSLFELDNFKEFLMINGFEPNLSNLNFFPILHTKKNIQNEKKFWSWFWNCKKVDINDWKSIERFGMHFWEQKNEDNVRIKPIEAIDLFRKSYKISNNYRVKLSLAGALLYRYFLGDPDEFNKLINEVYLDLQKTEFVNNPDYLYRVILIDLEAKHLSQDGLGKDFIDSLLNILKNLPGSEKYFCELDKVKQELGITTS